MRMQAAVVAIVFVALLGPALAARPSLPDGGGDGGGDGDPRPRPSGIALRCLQGATATLSAAPTQISMGGSSTLNWSVRLPANCSSFGRVLYVNGEVVGDAGSMSVRPMSSTTYSLKLELAGLTRQWHSTVEVKLSKTVHIKGSTAEWKNLLVQAVGEKYTRVILAHDVDMDLTFYSNIFISEGVTLTSEAPPIGKASAGNAPVGNLRSAVGVDTNTVFSRVARDAQHLGPRLYTRSRPKPLFEIRCNNVNIFGDYVRINGFRLIGPDFGSTNNEQGAIMINGCKDIDISNMEIAGWSGQAINVQDLEVARISKADDVKIHDNFIHHNQNAPEGNGYGVVVGGGAYALIERNVFDFNRHAIASDGKPGTGYWARQNLVLKGGGTSCWDNPGPNSDIFCGHTHQFDVHGRNNCGWKSIFSDTQFNCGPAGEYFVVTHNAFQYTRDNAFKLRGTPSIGAYVGNNVFAHSSLEDSVPFLQTAPAVHQNENGLSIGRGVNANVVGVDTYGQYGVCDFDADGKDDLFLATGVNWWYASGGKMHWTYLKEATERLHQIGLGDFDGDGRCDVFAANRFAKQWEISPGGGGAWTALPGSYDIPFEELRFGDFNGDRIMDVFRRAPDGQWSAISPGIYGWTPLGSSPNIPIDQLRFGHFNPNSCRGAGNDRVTDVIAVQGERWSVSLGGTTPWQPLNTRLSDRLQSVMIADINADGCDDILRYTPSRDGLTAAWQISWGGTTNWQPLPTFQLEDTPDTGQQFPPDRTPDTHKPLPTDLVRSFVGQFNDWPGADVLAADQFRNGHIYSNGSGGFSLHSLYAY